MTKSHSKAEAGSSIVTDFVERTDTTTFQYDPVPQQDDGTRLESPTTSVRKSWWVPRGSKATVKAFLLLAIGVFSINTAVTIWLAVSGSIEDGFGVLYQGSCSRVRLYDVLVHIAINILGTALLCSSSYSMQYLCAPTRDEVQTAHAAGEYLDIGVSSLHNLYSIKTVRAVSWMVLAISSIPLHLFYNSTIFSSIAANNFYVIAVNDAFIKPGPIDLKGLNSSDVKHFRYSDIFPPFDSPILPVVETLHAMAVNGSLIRLEKADCINTYAQTFMTSSSNLLLVTPHEQADGSVGHVKKIEVIDNDVLDISNQCVKDPYAWICPNVSCTNLCKQQLPQVLANVKQWEPFGIQVDYCLSQPTEEKCMLRYSVALMFVVIAFNLGKILVISFIVFRKSDAPLLTTGDAVASFICSPDPFTKDKCLYSVIDFEQHAQDPKPLAKHFKSNPVRWFSAAGTARYGTSLFLLILALSVVGGLLGWGINGLFGDHSFNTLWSLGLGSISPLTLIHWNISGVSTSGIIGSIIVANLPQVIFSVIYFVYNGLLTSMLAGREWSLYAWKKRSLRVSTPRRGLQRSSYRLQLPYRYAVPFVTLSMVLHWLMSQSLFIVSIFHYDPTGAPQPFWISACHDHIDSDFNTSTCHRGMPFLTCAWSPIAMIAVIIGGGVMTLYALLLGTRTYAPGMPLARGDSRVIAAACHMVEGTHSFHTAEMDLKWGVTSSGDGEDKVGHCAFSSGNPSFPIRGNLYSGLLDVPTVR